MAYFFIDEEPNVYNEAGAQAVQFANKLKNMRLQLQTLMNKKVRLELEIKALKKSIDNKTKEYDRTLKVKVGLESKDFDPNTVRQILNENPQLNLGLCQLREEYRLLQTFLENFDEHLEQ